MNSSSVVVETRYEYCADRIAGLPIDRRFERSERITDDIANRLIREEYDGLGRNNIAGESL
jgi:hypothetical protein